MATNSEIVLLGQLVCAVTFEFISVPLIIARQESEGKVGLKNNN